MAVLVGLRAETPAGVQVGTRKYLVLGMSVVGCEWCEWCYWCE